MLGFVVAAAAAAILRALLCGATPPAAPKNDRIDGCASSLFFLLRLLVLLVDRGESDRFISMRARWLRCDAASRQGDRPLRTGSSSRSVRVTALYQHQGRAPLSRAPLLRAGQNTCEPQDGLVEPPSPWLAEPGLPIGLRASQCRTGTAAAAMAFASNPLSLKISLPHSLACSLISPSI